MSPGEIIGRVNKLRSAMFIKAVGAQGEAGLVPIKTRTSNGNFQVQFTKKKSHLISQGSRI